MTPFRFSGSVEIPELFKFRRRPLGVVARRSPFFVVPALGKTSKNSRACCWQAPCTINGQMALPCKPLSVWFLIKPSRACNNVDSEAAYAPLRCAIVTCRQLTDLLENTDHASGSRVLPGSSEFFGHDCCPATPSKSRRRSSALDRSERFHIS